MRAPLISLKWFLCSPAYRAISFCGAGRCYPCNLWITVAFFRLDLYLSQQLPEFIVIYLNPVIQVKNDPLDGIAP